MSDYISKRALLDSLIYCDGLGRKSLEAVVKTINEQPTVDEKEIIRKPFERVMEKLEEEKLDQYSAKAEYISGMNGQSQAFCEGYIKASEESIKILKEECGISE